MTALQKLESKIQALQWMYKLTPEMEEDLVSCVQSVAEEFLKWERFDCKDADQYSTTELAKEFFKQYKNT